jgi:N-acetyl sugar amidotransferase
MDTVGDPDITFDHHGVCNYFYDFQERLRVRVPEPARGAKELDVLVKKIKESGKGKRYDCIIGVSGGADSTYTALLVKKLGLRPLAVHLDNGWDSELAVKNIENILNKLGIDLHTEVLDWEMFRDLQLSFLKASTPDGEIPTDHAITALLYKTAAQHGVRYVLSGMNSRTEGMLPPSWARGHLDWKYIRSVHKRFGSKPLKSFPHLSVLQFLYYNLIRRIRVISILNYVHFRKEDVVRVLRDELDWRNYGGKHYESVYTRFYQSYILPRKFWIDKRRAHLTCLIVSSNELTREQALEKLKEPVAEPQLLKEDREYVIKKLGLTEDEFNAIMSAPAKSILDYPNNHRLELWFRRLLNSLRDKKILPN